MPILVTDAVDCTRWDDFVTRHPLGTIYHHSSWQTVIAKTYGYRPLYYLLLDDNSNIKAAISAIHVRSWLTGNRVVSYPFSDSCDPLVADRSEFASLLPVVHQSRGDLGARFIEFRLARAGSFFPTTDLEHDYWTHLLSLDRDPESLLKGFHKSSIQRSIRKAQKEDLEVTEGNSGADMEAFYRLHLLTRKKHGVPIQPFRFFRALWDALFPTNMVTLLLARYRGRFVAGMIILWFKGVAYYKFGASDDRFEHTRVNQLLMWTAIVMACARGCDLFDFGRTSLSSTGLTEYKRRWGGVETPLYHARFPFNRRVEVLDERSRKHGVAKLVLSHMPTALIRISGELFYKHFA
jgi:hypothetical protein